MAEVFEKRFVWMSLLGLLLVAGSGVAMSYLNQRPSSESVAIGRMLFEHEFDVDDPLCGDGDGLGPVFNEKSCVACHFQGGVGGSGPNDNNVTTFEAFPTPGRPDVFSGGIHSFAIRADLKETVDQLEAMFPTIQRRTEMNGCAPTTREFNPLQVEEINTPPLFGLGLIDKISPAAVLLHGAKRSIGKVSRELEGDFDGTGIGRTRAAGAGRMNVGKFGWKGQFASLSEFVATACAMELGLTNSKVAQPVAMKYVSDQDAKLDMTNQQLRQLVDYVRSLPAPEQVLPDDPELRSTVIHGETLFAEVGCADCHVKNIGGIAGVYSDFHLYEVEHDDSGRTGGYVDPDFSPEVTLKFDQPRPEEWKTPPLWGVADSAPYFHDGQSPTLEAAILRHGRDGQFARQNYLRLKQPDKVAIISFLKSLRAPQGLSSQ